MGRDTVLVSPPEPALPRLGRVWAVRLTGGDVSLSRAVGVSFAEVAGGGKRGLPGRERSGHHTQSHTHRKAGSTIMSAMQLNLSPLKEPLGFIKVLEWISAICSFATSGGYYGTTQMIVSCVNSTVHPENKTTEASFAYPFRLSSAIFQEIGDTLCGGKWEDLHLTGDYSSPAQFYVTVAVFAFLYCIGALVLYLGFRQLYQSNSKLPLIDFILTVIFTFLWLVSSSAWAKGLTDVKTATDPINSAAHCHIPFKCAAGIGPHLKSLNISVLFGFLNWVLWTGNAWFVYKETTLHRPPASSTEHGTDQSPPPSSM